MGIQQRSINLIYLWAKPLSRQGSNRCMNDSDAEVCTEIPNTVSENTSIFVVAVAVTVKRTVIAEELSFFFT
jgi:hypothetical protein